MRSFALALALATVATPALAQESAPFTGARVEGVVGWDRLQAGGGRDDEVLYGVGAGYDVQMGGALIGGEVEYTDSDVRECVGAATTADPQVCVKSGRDLYAGGRIGTVVGGSTLLYAKAGYTNAAFKATSDDGTTESTLTSDNLDGVRAGAGAEFAVSQNAYVKGEYRYSNYEQGIERHQALAGFGFRF